MYSECNYCSRSCCDGCLVDLSWMFKYPVVYLTGTTSTSTYDTNRYELVEKKDWKLNNLKKELTKLQDTLKEYKDLEKYYANLAVTMEEKVNNVESEIKELEK